MSQSFATIYRFYAQYKITVHFATSLFLFTFDFMKINLSHFAQNNVIQRDAKTLYLYDL